MQARILPSGGAGRSLLISLAVAVGVLGVAAAVQAAIPDTQGVIHGCYRASGNPAGTLRVIDTGKGQKCVTGEIGLNWNQTGPVGRPGPTGPAGGRGTLGPTGAKGSTGSRGPSGMTGLTGPRGPSGTRGPSGASGISQIDVTRMTSYVLRQYAGNTYPPEFQDERVLSVPLPTGAWKIVVKHDAIPDGSCSLQLASGAPLNIRTEQGHPGGYADTYAMTYYTYATVSSDTSLELHCYGGQALFNTNHSPEYERQLAVSNILVELIAADRLVETQAPDVLIER